MPNIITAPGLVDTHVHLRDPGFTHKEDIITGSLAAAAGGVTTAVCMPNTNPVIDTPELVRYIYERAADAAVRVLPFAAVTVGQRGAELTDFEALKLAGAVALSDDGVPIGSADVMRRALLRARECDLVISTHSEDAEMVQNYAVNEGKISRLLDIPGRPAIAEEIMIARDAMLAHETGARVHIAHVSTAGSVEIIRRAKNEGIAITCETCPQYFTLTEDIVPTLGALARVNPPLRTEADRLAIIEGLRDGTIDAIATDHAPHSAEEKARGLVEAPSGMVGLETSLALTITALYKTGILTLEQIFDKMARNPAKILGLPQNDDFIEVDLDAEWTIEPDKFCSKSQNTPFGGMRVFGRVLKTSVRGGVVFGK